MARSARPMIPLTEEQRRHVADHWPDALKAVALVRRRCPWADPDDLRSDAHLAVIEAVQRHRGGTDLGWYVQYVVRLRLLDGLRVRTGQRHKMRRRYWSLTLDLPAQVEPDRLTAGEIGGRLGELVAGMRPQTRTVVLAAVIDEQPQTEIARDLGVSPSRVSQIVTRSLRWLRKRMLAG